MSRSSSSSSGPRAPSSTPRRVALMIAGEEYGWGGGKLLNPVRDQQRIGDMLRNVLGFTVRHVDPDLDSIADALQQLEDEISEVDVAFVFFSGHGIVTETASWFIPPCTKWPRTDSTLFDISGAAHLAGRARQFGMVVFDCCRQVGSVTSTKKVPPIRGSSFPLFKSVIAYACASGETASDGLQGGSPFAVAFAEVFGQNHAESSLRPTVLQQLAQVAQIVVKVTKTQRPWVSQSLSPEYVGYSLWKTLSSQKIPTTPAPVQLILEKLREVVRNSPSEAIDLEFHISARARLFPGGADSFNLVDFCLSDSFLMNPNPRVLLVRSGFGAGKTTFARDLCRFLWDRWTSPADLTPLMIPLSYLRSRGIHDAVQEALHAKCMPQSDILQLRMSKLNWVFLLDGYDEISCVENILKSNALADWGSSKVVVCCRHEFLAPMVNFEDFFRLTDTPHERLLQVDLCSLSDDEVKVYLEKWRSSGRPSRGLENYNFEEDTVSSRGLWKFKDAIRTPFLLRLVCESLPERTDETSLLSLFRAVVRQWFSRQAQKTGSGLSESDDLHSLEFRLAAFQTFSENLALRMLQEKTSVGNYQDQQEQSGVWFKFFTSTKVSVIRARAGCPILFGNGFSFVHKSFQEYFLACALMTQIKTGTSAEIFAALEMASNATSVPTQYFFSQMLEEAIGKPDVCSRIRLSLQQTLGEHATLKVSDLFVSGHEASTLPCFLQLFPIMLRIDFQFRHLAFSDTGHTKQSPLPFLEQATGFKSVALALPFLLRLSHVEYPKEFISRDQLESLALRGWRKDLILLLPTVRQCKNIRFLEIHSKPETPRVYDQRVGDAIVEEFFTLLGSPPQVDTLKDIDHGEKRLHTISLLFPWSHFLKAIQTYQASVVEFSDIWVDGIAPDMFQCFSCKRFQSCVFSLTLPETMTADCETKGALIVCQMTRRVDEFVLGGSTTPLHAMLHSEFVQMSLMEAGIAMSELTGTARPKTSSLAFPGFSFFKFTQQQSKVHASTI